MPFVFSLFLTLSPESVTMLPSPVVEHAVTRTSRQIFLTPNAVVVDDAATADEDGRYADASAIAASVESIILDHPVDADEGKSEIVTVAEENEEEEEEVEEVEADRITEVGICRY